MESSEVNLFQLETTAEVLSRKEFHTIKKKNHQVEQSSFVHKSDGLERELGHKSYRSFWDLV